MCNMCKKPINNEDRKTDENGDAVIDMEKVEATLKTINKDNLVNYIMEYEGGDICPECLIAFFQYLINTGDAFRLQGFYGRMATNLIEAGYCKKA